MPTTRIALILPSAQDQFELSQLPGYDFIVMDDPHFLSYSPMRTSFDSVAFTERCIREVRANKCEAIFVADDLANFVCAVVAKETGLPGSSIDSMLRANHKFYGRMAEDDPIAFRGYLYGEEVSEMEIAMPAQIKPTCLFFSLLQFRVADRPALHQAVTQLNKQALDWERPFLSLFARYGDAFRFPLAATHMFVAEEFVSGATQHAVEGWADSSGAQFIWAISDNNYATGLGTSLDNNSVPTALTPEHQSLLSKIAQRTAANYGFTSTFWNIEMWLYPDQRVKITEVNGRICASMTPLYREVFGRSQYPLALSVCLGKSPAASQAIGIRSTSRIGGMFAIPASRPGMVKNLIDVQRLDDIREWPGVVKVSTIYAPDEEIRWTQTGGKCCIARAWIVGGTREEITETARRIRRAVLLAE